jgi:hypothetical protein
MPGKKFQYWCFTTNDPRVPFVAEGDLKFVIEQPEQPPGKSWHRQGYAEFGKRLGMAAGDAGQRFRNSPTPLLT